MWKRMIGFVALILLIMSGVVLAQSQDRSKKGDPGTNPSKANKGQPNVMPAVSDDLKGLFTVLDDFGRAAMKNT